MLFRFSSDFCFYPALALCKVPQSCDSTITLLPLCRDRRYVDLNMEEFTLHFPKVEMLSHTSSCRVFKESCHQRIHPPL